MLEVWSRTCACVATRRSSWPRHQIWRVCIAGAVHLHRSWRQKRVRCIALHCTSARVAHHVFRARGSSGPLRWLQTVPWGLTTTPHSKDSARRVGPHGVDLHGWGPHQAGGRVHHRTLRECHAKAACHKATVLAFWVERLGRPYQQRSLKTRSAPRQHPTLRRCMLLALLRSDDRKRAGQAIGFKIWRRRGVKCSPGTMHGPLRRAWATLKSTQATIPRLLHPWVALECAWDGMEASRVAR